MPLHKETFSLVYFKWSLKCFDQAQLYSSCSSKIIRHILWKLGREYVELLYQNFNFGFPSHAQRNYFSLDVLTLLVLMDLAFLSFIKSPYLSKLFSRQMFILF